MFWKSFRRRYNHEWGNGWDAKWDKSWDDAIEDEQERRKIHCHDHWDDSKEYEKDCLDEEWNHIMVRFCEAHRTNKKLPPPDPNYNVPEYSLYFGIAEKRREARRNAVLPRRFNDAPRTGIER